MKLHEIQAALEALGIIKTLNELKNKGKDRVVQYAGTVSSIWGNITGDITQQSDLQILLNNKVDKEIGKGLSTEDYTTTEKNKLTNIEENAEVNVNADWESTSGDSEILNKPDMEYYKRYTFLMS